MEKMEQQQMKVTPTDDDINSFIIGIKSGFMEHIVKMLQKFSSHIVNRVETQSRQPSLYFASILIEEKMCYDIMKLLIENGANCHFKDQNDQTVMFYVCKDGIVFFRLGKEKCVDLLLKHKVAINEEDLYGQTPLYYVASENKVEIIKYFTTKDSFNHRDKLAGQTPLFYAARKGHFQMVRCLIQNGSDPTILDNHHKTAADYARKSKFIQIADYLSNEAKKIKEACKVQILSEASVVDNKKNQKPSRPIIQQNYRMVFMDQNGQSHNLTTQQVMNMLKDKPQLENYIKYPDSIPCDSVEKDGWQKIANKILTACQKLKGAFWFLQPVDPVKFNIMDYFDIITKPRDLGMIKRKLTHNIYQNPNEFVEDFRLIFTNCYRYNGQDHQISLSAKEVQTFFQESIKTQGLLKFNQK